MLSHYRVVGRSFTTTEAEVICVRVVFLSSQHSWIPVGASIVGETKIRFEISPLSTKI